MNREIKPGVMCIVIKSNSGNEGREVEVIRYVSNKERLPEAGLKAVSFGAGWVVKAKYPLKRDYLPDVDNRIGVYPSSWLLPIHPGNKSLETDDAEPIKSNVPSLTPA